MVTADAATAAAIHLVNLAIYIERLSAGLDGCRKVQRDRSKWTHNICTGYGYQRCSHITPYSISMRIGNGYVPPHGQRDCQPNGNCVTNLREYRMKHDEPCR